MINNMAETIYKRGIKIDQLIKNIEKEEIKISNIHGIGDEKNANN